METPRYLIEIFPQEEASLSRVPDGYVFFNGLLLTLGSFG
jgi:hypothetical protein